MGLVVYNFILYEFHVPQGRFIHRHSRSSFNLSPIRAGPKARMSAVLRHSRGAAIDGKRLNGCQNGQLAEMTQWRFSDRKRQAGRRSLHCQAVLALTRSVKVMQNSRMRPKASGLGPLSLILLMSLEIGRAHV